MTSPIILLGTVLNCRKSFQIIPWGLVLKIVLRRGVLDAYGKRGGLDRILTKTANWLIIDVFELHYTLTYNRTKEDPAMNWTVYLSGEIHTDWRQQVIQGAESNELAINFTSAVTDHAASDAAGDVLGSETDNFWRDHKSSKVNAIRTKTLIEKCDIAIVRFGDKFKQWNAAFDAGYCAALGKPYITLHDEDIIHPLKEVDASALAWASSPEQVVEILKYVTSA